MSLFIFYLPRQFIIQKQLYCIFLEHKMPTLLKWYPPPPAALHCWLYIRGSLYWIAYYAWLTVLSLRNYMFLLLLLIMWHVFSDYAVMSFLLRLLYVLKSSPYTVPHWLNTHPLILPGTRWSKKEKFCPSNATICRRREEWLTGLPTIFTTREGLPFLVFFCIYSIR